MGHRKTAVAVAAAAALTLGGFTPANAGGQVIQRGHCSGSAVWKMKVSPDNGALEVEAEVDSNVNGQRWRWRLTHNGSLSARGRKTTRPPSGSFEVKRRMANLSGTDTFRFRARHGNQVCRGRVSW